MALSTKDPDNDTKLNPASWDENTGARLSSAEQAAFDEIGDNFDADADSSNEDANLQKVKNAEDRGNTHRRIPDATQEARATKSKDKLSLSFMKKKGPLALIGLLLGGGGSLFVALLSPGLAIVQIKEAVMEDLNDAVSAMDERSQHIFRAKMKGQVSGLCTKQVSVRCKYKSMSKTQIKKMTKAGLEVKTNPERRSLTNGRYKIESISYHNSKGEKVTVRADEFQSKYRSDAHFRTAMNKYYSPRWMSIRDGAMDSVKNKFKLSFKRLINGKNKAEMKDQLNSNVKEGATERDGRKVTVQEKKVNANGDLDENGETKKVYVDADDNVIKGSDGKPLDPDLEEKKINDLKKMSAGGTGKMLTTGLKAANIYTGSQEVMCSILSLLRMAGVASRNIKFAQLMRYAIPFLNTADAIKTGAATPEATEFIGDIITKTDMRDKILADASFDPISEQDSAGKTVIKEAINNTTNTDPINLEPVDNPHKGKNALDSAGIKAAMYGSTSNLDLRESQASLSGGMGSKMVALVDSMRKLPGMPSENACAFWKNPIVQGAGAVLSVATIVTTCIFAACSGAAVSLVKAAATTSIAILVTMWVSNQIQDLTNGDMFSADSEGIDAGNAIFTGTAAFTSTSASTRGMNPISTPEEMRQSNKVAMEVKSRNIEVDTLEAQNTPYDIYNQYSFLGSIAWSLAPAARSSGSTLASIASFPLKILSATPAWLTPKASALVTSGPERYEKCDDEVFTRMNLKSADMMCNIRWGMSDQQLNSDPQKIVQWMVDSCQIDPVSGDVNPSGKCPDGCKVGDAGTEACSRTTTPEQALAMLNSTPDQVASAMAYDDNDSIADSKPIQATQAASSDPRLPSSVTNIDSDLDPEEDVRTYAHFLRYCRYGPEEGARTVNFGDPDAKDGNVLTGLAWDAPYSSIGKECLAANNCKPGQDPNRAYGMDSERALNMCRPPQYDIYAVYTMDKTIEEGMDEEDDGAAEESSDGLVTGEAKELAKRVAEHENIEFVNPASKEALLKFANTGQATNACGEKYGINPLLSGVMLTMAEKWKLKVNNFGFQSDRNFCDSSPSNQHRMGNAIDLNGIQKVGGSSAGSDGWGSLNYSGGQTALITEFAIGWMDALATKEPTRGRSGQLGCGGFNLLDKRKPNWQGHDGNLHFNDSCDHLHIDVGDRVDASKR